MAAPIISYDHFVAAVTCGTTEELYNDDMYNAAFNKVTDGCVAAYGDIPAFGDRVVSHVNTLRGGFFY